MVPSGASVSLDSHNSSNSSNSSDSTECRSRSIPISKYIHRTPSELQLYEEEVIADHRDYCMYSLIVSGISRQQMAQQTDIELRYQNDETLANIIRTRHTTDDYTNTTDRLVRYLEQANDDEWAPNLSEMNNCDQGVFVLDL
jgi:hypothetical protein